MQIKKWGGAIAALAMLSQAPAAHAFSYAASYINNWSSCDSACNGNNSLSYTDDQIDDFDSAMSSLGHTRNHKFANGSVWGSDYTEDLLNGQDYLYSDDSDIVVYSGHGGAPTYSSGQTFVAPLCHAGTSSSCTFNASNARFGERSGYYSSPNPGDTRWLLWFTCYSVHTAPNEQWGEAFYRGLEYVMGYRGTSADSSTTVEVPGDWVGAAISGSDTFKSAWFWAIEDWWVDDTGAVASTGPDSASSDYRRDNLKRTWARRSSTDLGNWISWSWHEG